MATIEMRRDDRRKTVVLYQVRGRFNGEIEEPARDALSAWAKQHGYTLPEYALSGRGNDDEEGEEDENVFLEEDEDEDDDNHV